MITAKKKYKNAFFGSVLVPGQNRTNISLALSLWSVLEDMEDMVFVVVLPVMLVVRRVDGGLKCGGGSGLCGCNAKNRRLPSRSCFCIKNHRHVFGETCSKTN